MMSRFAPEPAPPHDRAPIDHVPTAAELAEQRPAGPDPDDVTALTELLELLDGYATTEQRARYLLSSNWLRDRGAAAAARLRGTPRGVGSTTFPQR